MAYTVRDKSKNIIYESNSFEACLAFCRKQVQLLKVYRGETLLAYKSSGGPGRGRPPKKLDAFDEE